MNETIKCRKSEFHILKKRIEHIKNRKNNLKNKNTYISSRRNKKFLSIRRPNSNYIQSTNKILSQESINIKFGNSQIKKPIMSNKLISTDDLDDNSLSIINKAQKYFNINKNNNVNEKNKKMNKSQSDFQKCFYKRYKVPKSAKNDIKIYKNILSDKTIFNEVNNSIYSNRINREKKEGFSNRNLIHKNKYLELIKELFSGNKNKNTNLEPNSSSTTINTNINNSNSCSSHFLFGLSSFNSNKNQNAIQSNQINQKEGKINENNKLTTSIENDLNRLLILKKEKDKQNKGVKKLNSAHLYKNYDKILNLKEKATNISLKRNSINNDENSCFNHSTDVIKSIRANNMKTDKKNNNNNKYNIYNDINYNNKNIRNKNNNNKASNLIVKYAFLNYEICGIKRKVDFLNPKNGEHISLDTTNVDYNNINNQNKDFKTCGYEMIPEELYYLKKRNIQKNKIIKIHEEKKVNKYYKEIDDKKIRPKYYLLKKDDNIKYKNNNYQKYRTIDIKNCNKKNKNELKETKSNKGNDTNDLLNIYSFGLGESSYKNRIDFQSIKKEDLEEGKHLWSKLKKINKSTVDISDSKQKMEEELSNIQNIEKNKFENRAKSSRNIEKNINKLNKKERPRNSLQKYIRDKNISHYEFIRKNKNRNLTQKMDTLKIRKSFRKEKGFNEIKKTNYQIYDIDFKITDEDEKEKDAYSKGEKIEIENEKVGDLKQMKTIEPYIKNKKVNISKKRNTAVFMDQFVNKLYKVKKPSKENLNETNNRLSNNKNIKINDKYNSKNKKAYYNIYKSNKYNYSNKIKGKYNEKFKNINKKNDKVSKEIKKEDKKENYFSRNKSFEKEENPILELYTSIDSIDEQNNLSEENYINNGKLEIDNTFKRLSKKKSTLLFDTFLKNFKFNYKEDENMIKYFDEIFNKYGKDEKDEQFVDIKFFGFYFKIKRKNQQNFKDILMNNIRQKANNRKISLILDRFIKNRKSIKNKDIFSSSILFNRYKRTSKNINNIFEERLKNKKKTNNNQKFLLKINEKTKEKKNEEIKEKEEEFKSKYFLGIKLDSINELEKKRDEILKSIKNDVQLKIMNGEVERSEMDNFFRFQKRMSAYHIDSAHCKKLIKLLDQEFISFNEELELKEQKKKEEKRINNFIDNMNFDIQNDNYIKSLQKKFFCSVYDFNEKFNINVLSPTKDFLVNPN